MLPAAQGRQKCNERKNELTGPAQHGIRDDFYSAPLAWSSTGHLAVALNNYVGLHILDIVMKCY